MKTRIMVVDDDMNMRDLMITLLESEGYDVIPAESAAAAQAAFDGPQPDAALLDLQLPDGHGLDLLPTFKKHWPETEVIVLTGNATLEAAVEATKRGAIFFQSKPVDPKNLMVLVKRALEQKQLKEEASSLRQALSTMTGGASPIFQSPAMKAVVHTVERVAPSDVSILITGESGTGKEVIADLVHALSPRSKGPLIKVNCAALPRELIESELFGSVKGAYTGAQADREGLFRQADGGTLMLDEISEMPIDTQSKLLRVLQEKEVRPVGGRTSYKTDSRVIAATNRPPEEAIKAGKLRHKPPAGGGHQSRQTARRPVLPHQRDFHRATLLAGAPRGHSAAGHFVFETVRRAGQSRHHRIHSRGRRVAAPTGLAGQRSAVAERSAARGPHVRKQTGGRAGFVPERGEDRNSGGRYEPHVDGSDGTQYHPPDAQGNRR